jgi:hypothetical protein
MTGAIDSVQHDVEKVSAVLKRDEMLLQQVASGRISRGCRTGVVVCLQEFEAAVSSALVSLSQRTDGIAREVMEMHCTTLDRALDTLKKIERTRTVTIYDRRKISWLGAVCYKILSLIGYCCGGKVYVALNQAPLSSTSFQEQLLQIRNERLPGLVTPKRNQDNTSSASASSVAVPMVNSMLVEPTSSEPSLPRVIRRQSEDRTEIEVYWSKEKLNIWRENFAEGEEVFRIFSAVTGIALRECVWRDNDVKAIFSVSNDQQVTMVTNLAKYAWNPSLPKGGYFEVLVGLIHPGLSTSYMRARYEGVQEERLPVEDSSKTEERILRAAWTRFEAIRKVGDFICKEFGDRLSHITFAQNRKDEDRVRQLRENCVIYDQVRACVLAEARYQRPKSPWLSSFWGVGRCFLREIEFEELKDIVLRDFHAEGRIRLDHLPDESRDNIIRYLIANANREKVYFALETYNRGAFFSLDDKKEIEWGELLRNPGLDLMKLSENLRKELLQRLTRIAPAKALVFLEKNGIFLKLFAQGALELMHEEAQKLPDSSIRTNLIEKYVSLRC